MQDKAPSLTDRRTLLRDIDGFRKRHRISASRFGEMALKDTAFVSRLRAGREPRSVTVKRIYRCMRRFNANEGNSRG